LKQLNNLLHQVLFFSFLISISGLISCHPNPYRDSNRMQRQQLRQMIKVVRKEPTLPVSDSITRPPYWVGTTNFNWRRPGYVIIHHTAQNSCDQTLKTFITPAAQVSAHYVICKDGTLHQMLNDYLRANHAGVSRWGNMTDINSLSIGIELDNNGFEPFDSLQINSLLSLLGHLKKQYNLPAAHFIGHGDIAPTRKNDPNFRFPWKLLAARGFGLWYSDTLASVPTDFNHLQALRIIGYDMRDTSAAIRAFKRHFMQDTTRRLTDVDKQVLFDLQRKYF
jgi:N-acetylmuramoyl-L-alanine amidase